MILSSLTSMTSFPWPSHILLLLLLLLLLLFLLSGRTDSLPSQCPTRPSVLCLAQSSTTTLPLPCPPGPGTHDPLRPQPPFPTADEVMERDYLCRV
ncbi:hypothetical protein M430DRAFT_242470 [Amorphotheca resinae ATCC 22711]|uniref:Uncharacterized protein n=1 Tax=Amorphotheca resinae ATCC 22711 TaxID=857342 RepID=A0A2T3B290_AMORE|nr:hypothetical protein M430DRAFT_242470 [Amorphotheca resinae ATCC 22711]PSS18668.1 hypothetical protein M430DRAFT_242470 [Amorphotheca resinae ATCC 22711]